MTGFWIICGFVLAWTLLTAVARMIGLQPYRRRTSTVDAWLVRFPDAFAEKIDPFLGLVVDAFGFSNRWKFRFLPEDRIMDINRACHPGINIAGCMEIESLAVALDQEYGLRLLDIWKDQLTLGEIFATVTRSRQIGAGSS